MNIDPLNRAQQLFLQRLLASHVLDDAQALSLWNEIDSFPDCNQQLGRDLPSTLSTINRSLKPGFSLEIRSVSLKLGPVNGNDDDLPKKYYSIVNCDGDGVSIVGNATKTPHELAFFRLILERMIEADIAEDEENEEEDDDENDERTRQRNARKRARRGRGCQSSITRMNAINLRTELSGPHKDKLSIAQAEQTLNNLVAEGWLVISESDTNKRTRNNDSQRRRSSGANSTSFIIGPRTYMETSEFLEKMGMDIDRLPQLILI